MSIVFIIIFLLKKIIIIPKILKSFPNLFLDKEKILLFLLFTKKKIFLFFYVFKNFLKIEKEKYY